MITKIDPYLNFPGTAEEAFSFYHSLFGGELMGPQRFGDVEGMDNLSEEEKNKIMHVAISLENGTLLMGSDILESMGHEAAPGNNVYISLSVESKEEADRLFSDLSKDGKVEMAMEDTFWGDYFGIAVDRYKVQWMISYTYPQKQ